VLVAPPPGATAADGDAAPAAPGRALLALHFTMPPELPAVAGVRLVPGDAPFCAVVATAAAALLAAKTLSFRVPRARALADPEQKKEWIKGKRPADWWHCAVRALPAGGEEPMPGVRTLPPGWAVSITPAARAEAMDRARERQAAGAVAGRRV
jgi:hypothetical protein